MGDAEALELDNDSFDAVICASSIFLLADTNKALQKWRCVLKLGGKVAFSSFGPDFMRPAYGLFLERLTRYDGIELPGPQASARTGTPEKCRELLENAGFTKIKVTSEQMGDYLKDAQDYWREASSTIMRVRLDRLGPARLEQFRAEHLAEVAPLCTDKGIWMDIPVHFSIAVK